MSSIITEELRFHKLICEYAIKHKNNAEAAKRYHTSRQQVQRWVKCYDRIIEFMDRCAVKYEGIYLRQRNLNNIIKASGSLMWLHIQVEKFKLILNIY